MDKKIFAYVFVTYFVVITYWLWSNNDTIIMTVANDGWTGLVYYFLSNVQYALIIVSIFLFNPDAGFIKNSIGGFLIVASLDIVSLPRLTSGVLPKDIGILASSDGIVAKKLLALGFSYPTLFNFYYLVLPILMIFIAINVLGISTFLKTLLGKKFR